MESIIKETLVSFKDFEKKIFVAVCELGQEITKRALEAWDDELAGTRDKVVYRDKGKRTTSIKTLYGTVSYRRRVYQTKQEDGKSRYVYLLDEWMGREPKGLFSANLVESIVHAATELSYRAAAEQVSRTCGQAISHGGVWNLVQDLGKQICQEEEETVHRMEAGQTEGTKTVPILFEEMDGVWLSMQDGKHRKRKKQELKVATMYEGWDAASKGQSRLVGKTVLAGMEESRQFHAKREALLESLYDIGGIGQRVLNGDGGGWIQEEYDPDVIFQLDRYHVYRGILRGIREKKKQGELRKQYEEGQAEELLSSIWEYIGKLEEEGKEEEAKKAEELYTYLRNNRDGLLPWDKRGKELPPAPEGIVYKRMGIQENQNCTLITMRMKHRRARWGKNGANHLVKVLCRKENRELEETIQRYTHPKIATTGISEARKVLSAGKVPKKEGKGSPYLEKISCQVPLLAAKQTEGRKVFRAMLSGGWGGASRWAY